MKVRVSDYIAEFISSHGIKDVFTVVGGGAMYLNHSLGHHSKIRCTYNHHEQASSMAAEAYYRVNGDMACVCVTSGPGAINALNGVAGAYQDSIPMIIFSGQCKSELMVRKTGLNLRTLGPQEFDIVPTLGNYTKYAVSLTNPLDVRYCLEKAFSLALSGRPGPCWIEVPVDIQGAIIETENLRKYEVSDENAYKDYKKIKEILNRLAVAKRPVIYAGNGIRIASAYKVFKSLVNKLKIPVVTCWDSIDLIETDNKYYVGRGGTMGDRPGNFAVQNSDFLLVLGSRLNTYQVGYQVDLWAREAYVAIVDIDFEELLKPTIHADITVCMDVKKFMEQMILDADKIQIISHTDWNKKCNEWKNKYPVVSGRQKKQESPVNVYAFIDQLSRSIPEDMITVVANGSASVVGSQTYYIGRGNRFIMNCGISSMGYDLPAAIGACVANRKKSLVCIAGDGSIQMNIQELQTIVTNNLPIKIVILNNDGYQQIRITQTNLFNANYVGIGPESGDLEFPDFSKIAYAYGIPYMYCDCKTKMNSAIEWMLNESGVSMLEVHCDTKQFFEPKSAAKRRKDGSLYSPPLEDLAPFLSREELRDNMYIELKE